MLHASFNAARAAGEYHHLLLTAAYVFDFLVVHPFGDGNGRMSRLISLWLLYLGGYEVGRYISLEKLVEVSKETYYEALAQSTVGWHEGRHDMRPWVEYFLGVIDAAYTEFGNRTSVFRGRDSKTKLVERLSPIRSPTSSLRRSPARGAGSQRRDDSQGATEAEGRRGHRAAGNGPWRQVAPPAQRLLR
jgi:Fic family protein